MAILFNTARSRYPDIIGDRSGEFVGQIQSTLTRVLQAVGARVFQNSFIEDGTMRVPGTSFAGSHISDVVAPSKRRILSQDVQPSVVIKKRMFSTLRENFDPDYFDEKEQLYIRAIKTLFRKKCEDIAFYESLIFVDKIIEDPDFIYASGALGNLFNAIFDIASIGLANASALDLLGATQTSLAGASSQMIRDMMASQPWLQQLFRVMQASEQAKQNKFTTWIVDPLAGDMRGTGPGVGVMEFTMMSNITTTTTLSTGEGKCDITLQDPYRLSVITEDDIDRALKEAYLENGRIPSYITERAKQIANEAMQLDVELNASRRSRGVSEINFNFPFGTDTDVSATLIALNQPFTENDLVYGTDDVSDARRFVNDLRAGRGFASGQGPQESNIPEEQRFTATEQIRVKQIFELLREYKVIQDRAIDEFQLLNNLNSDVLDRMRQEFVGHHIIQHMDAIHVFANSFTRDETPLYDTTLAQLAQNVSTSVLGLEDAKARISDDFIDQERIRLAPDIPLWIYKLMRNPHVFRGTGPQIWQGIISGVSSSYRAEDGFYAVNIRAKDNMHFLEISRINTQPGLTQLQGALEDPLTPNEIKIEPATGLVESTSLLPENIKRIEAGVVKFHDYPFLGKDVLTAEELSSDTSQNTQAGTKTLRHVNGLLYRWKRGILTVTQNINVNRPLGDTFASVPGIEQDYGLTVLNNVFAKLDAADILSILICGKPYNYNTFIRAALDSGSITLSNEGSSNAYFDHLFDIFEQSNPTNGRFLPAITEVIDRERATQAAAFERQVSRAVGSINALQRQLAGIKGKIANVKLVDGSIAVQEQLKMLQAEQVAAEAALRRLNSTMSNVGDVRIFGDDVVQHLTDDENNQASKRVQYILLKKPEDVKYNKDNNFFVVSDRYSTDLSIQSFVQDLKDNQGFDPFKNTYKHPIEIAQEVANVLHFELFADSQGNINFRPPEYNKIPLSLMLRLIQLGQTDGVSLVPPFIENLIKNRAQTYKDRLTVIELEIRERVAFLGGIDKLNDYADGSALGAGLKYITRAYPSGSSGLVTYAIDDVALREASLEHAAFTEGTQTDLALENLDSEAWPTSLNENEIITEVMSVRNDLRRLTGHPAEEYFADSIEQRAAILSEINKYTNANGNAASERLRLTNEISVRVSKRQTLINATVRLLDQQSGIDSAATFNGPGALIGAFFSSMVSDTAAIFGNDRVSFIPKFIQDMVINDLQNTFGRNSGKRFVIEDDVILSMDFEIKPPDFTRINVYGSENLLGQGEAIVTGNPLAFWAGASDFDLWRQFGYRHAADDKVPYLNNPETQLAPYAVMRLMQQRGQIHTGSITIVGNEHYQVGETVYIAAKEMLYYITSVNHSIDLRSNSFTTTLQLAYGRPLGQYIPQPFDIIGRTLLADAARGGLNQRVNRAPPASAQVKVLETLYFPIKTSEAPAPDIDNGPMQHFIKTNASKIKNAIIKAHSTISSSGGASIKLEIRGFMVADINKLTGRRQDGKPVVTPTEDTIKAYMSAIRSVMTTGIYPEETIPLNDSLSIDATQVNDKSEEAPQRIEEKYFKQGSDPGAIVVIDRKLTDDDIKYRRMPSQRAWMSDSIDPSGQSLGLPVNALDIAIIVDRSVTGDSAGEQTQGQHIAPAQAGELDASLGVPNDDMGKTA